MSFRKYGSKISFLAGLHFDSCSITSIASICLVLKGFDNKLSKINASSSSSIMLSWKNGINHSKKLLNWTCEIDLIFTWLIVPIQQKCLNPFNFSRDAAACGPSTNDTWILYLPDNTVAENATRNAAAFVLSIFSFGIGSTDHSLPAPMSPALDSRNLFPRHCSQNFPSPRPRSQIFPVSERGDYLRMLREIPVLGGGAAVRVPGAGCGLSWHLTRARSRRHNWPLLSAHRAAAPRPALRTLRAAAAGKWETSAGTGDRTRGSAEAPFYRLSSCGFYA